MASKKYNQLVNIVKKEVTHRYREQAGGNQWWWGGDYQGERVGGGDCWVYDRVKDG